MIYWGDDSTPDERNDAAPSVCVTSESQTTYRKLPRERRVIDVLHEQASAQDLVEHGNSINYLHVAHHPFTRKGVPQVPTVTITGVVFGYLAGPVVYVWRRGPETLYVGMSGQGLRRLLDPNHQRVWRVHQADQIEIWSCATRDAARELEFKLIEQLRPTRNIVGNLERAARIIDAAPPPSPKPPPKPEPETLRPTAFPYDHPVMRYIRRGEQLAERADAPTTGVCDA